LADAPETINGDAFGDGWMFKLRLSEPDQLGDLLDADAYAEVMAEDEH
jgi:glycine cleavage system H protein